MKTRYKIKKKVKREGEGKGEWKEEETSDMNEKRKTIKNGNIKA